MGHRAIAIQQTRDARFFVVGCGTRRWSLNGGRRMGDEWRLLFPPNQIMVVEWVAVHGK